MTVPQPLAALWNYRGSFRKYWSLGTILRAYDLIGLEQSMGMGNF